MDVWSRQPLYSIIERLFQRILSCSPELQQAKPKEEIMSAILANHDHDHSHKPHAKFVDLHARAFDDVREITGTTRPAASQACKLATVVPGLYIGKFEEIKEPDSFTKLALSPPVGLVINAGAANDQCPTKTGFYGKDVLVLPIDLLDDPAAGDAKQHFRAINANILATISSGKGVIVHCFGSISRASVFVIAYLMETLHLSTYEATSVLKKVAKCSTIEKSLYIITLVVPYYPRFYLCIGINDRITLISSLCYQGMGRGMAMRCFRASIIGL